MQISVLASRDVFDQAIRDARKADAQTSVDGFASVLDLGLQGRLEEAWGAIESALKAGFQFGQAKAQEMFDAAVAATEQLLAEAGHKADEIQRRLLERMQGYVQSYVQGAITRIPASISVGNTRYVVTSVTCTQKILLAGSIKASLAAAFELTVNGELQVAVAYSVPQPEAARL
jgi:hypothetical protein